MRKKRASSLKSQKYHIHTCAHRDSSSRLVSPRVRLSSWGVGLLLLLYSSIRSSYFQSIITKRARAPAHTAQRERWKGRERERVCGVFPSFCILARYCLAVVLLFDLTRRGTFNSVSLFLSFSLSLFGNSS